MVVIGLWACTTTPIEKEETEAIRKMVFRSMDAWNKGDIKGYMMEYHQDSNTQFITRRGALKGWNATLNNYLKHYPNRASMGVLSFELDTIELLKPASAGLGHVNGKWKLIRAQDTPQGYFSLITKKTKEGPKIIIDHTW
jgi:hypothetical protein